MAPPQLPPRRYSIQLEGSRLIGRTSLSRGPCLSLPSEPGGRPGGSWWGLS